MTRVTAPRAVKRAIVAHARAAAPRECCGFLLGRGREIVCSMPMPNIARGPSRYRVDPRSHIALRRLLPAFVPALSILGVYHSHPRGAAAPSPADIAQSYVDEWIHVIVGLGRSRVQVRAFRLAHGREHEVRMHWAVDREPALRRRPRRAGAARA